MNCVCKIPSPVGELTVSSDGHSITGLWLEGQKYFAETLEENTEERDLPVFEAVKEWLECYFSGKNPDFTPPLAPSGTAFRQAVWEKLREIPYGCTTTYGALARQLGERTEGNISARSVGGAVGRNPISIIIPCHRVVGVNGGLTGYAGGIEKKEYLLRLEKAAGLLDINNATR